MTIKEPIHGGGQGKLACVDHPRERSGATPKFRLTATGVVDQKDPKTTREGNMVVRQIEQG